MIFLYNPRKMVQERSCIFCIRGRSGSNEGMKAETVTCYDL